MSLAEPAQTVVLLVEDEPVIRMCAADVLEDEGFEVTEAAACGDPGAPSFH
jgi:CheY-like chemotaxis protein